MVPFVKPSKSKAEQLMHTRDRYLKKLKSGFPVSGKKYPPVKVNEKKSSHPAQAGSTNVSELK